MESCTVITLSPEEVSEMFRAIVREELLRVNDRPVRKKEAADIIGISTQTLENWERKGTIKRLNSPGQPRYLLSDVIKLKKL